MQLLKPEEVAEQLGVAPDTIARWANAGLLPGIKLGTKWRFEPAKVKQFLRERQNTPSRRAEAAAAA